MAGLFFFVVHVSRVAAQDLQTADYAGFEGQKVSKVRVSANPKIPLDQIQPLIQQKAGEPFAINAIQESAKALQNTKLFSRVQVSIAPGESGVEVLFILQPTSYVGILDFPGATKMFTYPALLQTVNIPEQSPYVPDMPEQGTQALLAYFHRNGYFEATVTPEVTTDDPHRVVNIRFVCRLNRPAKIGVVNISGLSPEQAADVRRALESFWARLTGASLKPGKSIRRKKSISRSAIFGRICRARVALHRSCALTLLHFIPIPASRI